MPVVVANPLCDLADVKAELRLYDVADDARVSHAIAAASRLIETKCFRRFYQDPAPRVDAGCTVTGGSTQVLDASITAADVGHLVSGAGLPPLTVAHMIVPGVSFELVDARFQNPQPATSGGTEDLTIGFVPRRFVTTDPWLVETDDISSLDGLEVRSDYTGDGSFSTVWDVRDYQLEPVNALSQAEPWPFTVIRAIRSLYFPEWGGIAFPKPKTQALCMVTARWGWPAVPSPVTQAAIIQSVAVFKATDAPFGATGFAETGIIRMREDLHPAAALLLDTWMEQGKDLLIA